MGRIFKPTDTEEYWVCAKDRIIEEGIFKRRKRYVFRPIVKIDDGKLIRLNRIRFGTSYSEHIIFIEKK